MTFRVSTFLALVALLGAAPVNAEEVTAAQKARVRRAMQIMDAEPTVIEVHRAALEFFRIHPEEINRIRRMAKRRAAAPTVTVGGRYERVGSGRDVIDPIVPMDTDDNFDANVYGASLELEWNLPTAVFNPAELQSYALIGIQVNILKEVTRLYYVRRQLLLSLLANPPDDPRTRLAMSLRVEEFTSLIDSFTGGWFSPRLPAMPDASASPSAASPPPAKRRRDKARPEKGGQETGRRRKRRRRKRAPLARGAAKGMGDGRVAGVPRHDRGSPRPVGITLQKTAGPTGQVAVRVAGLEGHPRKLHALQGQ